MLRELLIGAVAVAAASRLQDKHLLDLNLTRVTPSYVPPTTTITLPTYNDGDVIEIALKSITDQTMIQAYPDRFEILVIDQGTDNTKDVVSEYPQVKYARSPKGKLRARDLGFHASTSDVVLNIDSDAYYPPNYLSLMLTPFQDATVVATIGKTIAFTGSTISDLFWMPLFNAAERIVTLATTRMAGLSNAVRRDAYFRVGGFDLSYESWGDGQMVSKVQVEEEFRFGQRLAKIGRVTQTDGVAIHWFRRWLCMYTLTCKANSSSPLCQYCNQIQKAGGRF